MLNYSIVMRGNPLDENEEKKAILKALKAGETTVDLSTGEEVVAA